jgi:hypothetical protein
MRIRFTPLLLIPFLALVIEPALAAPPSMDGFNIQSFLKLSNNSPVTASSGDFVFAIFKNGNCIWAKRYSGIPITNGMMNQKISGMGTNITLISNTNAGTGECVANFSTVNLDSTLLSNGSAGPLSIRVYAETTIDTQKPIWDIPMNTVPTAMIAQSSQTADDLIASMKTNQSTGATDAGKFAVLNGSGYIDNTMLNFSSFSLNNTQINGLGSACTVNTGTTVGTIPVLSSGGKLSSSLLPTFQANKVMATDATGTLSGMYNTTTASSGSGDASKIPLLNASGRLDASMIDSSDYVDRSNTQTIGGNKTFTDNVSLSGSFTLGAGGSGFQKVLKCAINSSQQNSGTESTSSCSGVTANSIVQCSPSTAPASGWIVAASRASASNQIAVMPLQVTGSDPWTTGFQCVVFVP